MSSCEIEVLQGCQECQRDQKCYASPSSPHFAVRVFAEAGQPL